MTTDCDESVWCEVRLTGSDKLLVGCVYRSPNSNRENDVKINTTLHKANSSGYSHVLVCGDFNHSSLNWRDSTSPTDVNHPASFFMEAVRDSFLVQHVTEPTHYRGDNMPNTLDLIFTNESGMLDCLKYMAPIGKSHHSSLKMDFCCYTNASNTSKDRHIYDKGDYDSMREMMRSREWEMELSDKTVDERWTTTMGAINDATRKCIPKRRSNGKGIIKKMKPIWMDEKVTAAVKRKTEAYTKYRQSREGTDYINYRRAANRVKAEVRKAVRTFEKRIATEAKKNPKAFFNYAMSKMKTRTGVSDLEYPDGRMAHTDVEKAELLNSFFSDVFTKEDLVTTPTFERRVYREPLTDITTNDDIVAAVLGRLKPNKSPGGDGLHPRVLVELKNEMATPLRMIFTRSLQEGRLPPSWKEANVTPIYKKGKRHIPGNYRPVSLTSMAGKCMERLIRDAIMTHMTENDLLSPKQHGFIQGRYCVTQLLAVLDSWTLALDEGGNIDTIYLDFAKAFDTVPHQRLLTKLRGYGIEGRILTWIKAFLTNRRQRVVINGSRSSWADVTSGIPQGSVLGPVLFICYINDMPSSVQSSMYLFADDAKLYRNIASDDDPLHSSTTFSNWRNGQRNGSCISTQASVRSCTLATKTQTETTPWAQQHWLQQPARRILACTWTQS